MTQPTERHEHQWTFNRDWEGDPTIPNGTHDISEWECVWCGLCVSAAPGSEFWREEPPTDYGFAEEDEE